MSFLLLTLKQGDPSPAERKITDSGSVRHGCSLVTNSCLTLCDPMYCSPPGSSVHGIFQARILDGWPFPSPGDLPDLGIEPASPALARGFFTAEPPGKPPVRHTQSRCMSSIRAREALLANQLGDQSVRPRRDRSPSPQKAKLLVTVSGH